MGKLQQTRVVMRNADSQQVSQQQNVRYYNHDGATGLGYDAAGNLQGYYQVGADEQCRHAAAV